MCGKACGMAGCKVAFAVQGESCQPVSHDDSAEGAGVWLCHREEQLASTLCSTEASGIIIYVP